MRGLELPSGRRGCCPTPLASSAPLPTELVAAFRATLEEVAEADLILHACDAAHPGQPAQRADVIAALDGTWRRTAHWMPIGRDRNIEARNKADLLGSAAQGRPAPGRSPSRR